MVFERSARARGWIPRPPGEHAAAEPCARHASSSATRSRDASAPGIPKSHTSQFSHLCIYIYIYIYSQFAHMPDTPSYLYITGCIVLRVAEESMLRGHPPRYMSRRIIPEHIHTQTDRHTHPYNPPPPTLTHTPLHPPPSSPPPPLTPPLCTPSLSSRVGVKAGKSSSSIRGPRRRISCQFINELPIH